MKIACLCPTFRRPEMLASAAECFLRQEYHPKYSRLYILDDADQFDDQVIYNHRIHLRSISQRFATLPDKFNALANWAINDWPEVEAFCIWEDDDVYLKHHVVSHAVALEEFDRTLRSCSMPSFVRSNYSLPKDGSTQVESGTGRFHGSWAFSRWAFEKVRGWPSTARLSFDQEYGASLRSLLPPGIPVPDPCNFGAPTYVYRWGSGPYNGSQWGECDFVGRTGKLDLPAERVGLLIPQLDDETKLILKALGEL